MKQILFTLLSTLLLGNQGVQETTVKEKMDSPLDWIGLSADGSQLVQVSTGEPFLFWGVNYDRDIHLRLLEEYWIDEWDTVVKHFSDMKAMGLNAVRIHLEFSNFMESPTQPKIQALNQLTKLIHLAEELRIYLYVTGLGSYKKENVPLWYDDVDEEGRWRAQANFWKYVARTCAFSPAVMCFDLMNEPVIPGGIQDWLHPEGCLDGLCYVQRISRDPKGRTAQAIAKAWVDTLVEAIRSEDSRHLITVGAIPILFAIPGSKHIFYDPDVSKNLDIVSVHFYPRGGKVEEALDILKQYSLGKPLIVAELFAMHCSHQEMDDFIEGSRSFTQGWFSFYWGKTIEEYAQDNTIGSALFKDWLVYYRDKGKKIKDKR